MYFIEEGFDVTAVDGSEALCELAKIEIGQEVQNIRFEELEFVGKYNNIIDSDFLTTIYKKDKELYIAQLCRDKIFVISQIIEICRGLNTKMTKNFSIKDKEYSYTYKEIAIIFSSKDKKYSIFVNDEEKYIVDEKLIVEDEEMVMIKLLDNFFDDSIIEVKKCL